MAPRLAADSVVHRAQLALLESMGRGTRMSALASELAVSERTLARRFRVALGLSPLAYLQELRMERARALLRGGGLTVDQVAQRVGFSNTSSFSRLFRRRVGCSPSAYGKARPGRMDGNSKEVLWEKS